MVDFYHLKKQNKKTKKKNKKTAATEVDVNKESNELKANKILLPNTLDAGTNNENV